MSSIAIQQITELAAKRLTNVQIAQVLNMSESYVSELRATILENAPEEEVDKAYNDLEDRLLEDLSYLQEAQVFRDLSKPGITLAAIRTLNSARRRGGQLGEAAGSATTIRLQVRPDLAQELIKLNSANEIVQIGDTSFLSASSKELKTYAGSLPPVEVSNVERV